MSPTRTVRRRPTAPPERVVPRVEPPAGSTAPGSVSWTLGQMAIQDILQRIVAAARGGYHAARSQSRHISAVIDGQVHDPECADLIRDVPNATGCERYQQWQRAVDAAAQFLTGDGRADA